MVEIKAASAAVAAIVILANLVSKRIFRHGECGEATFATWQWYLRGIVVFI